MIVASRRRRIDKLAIVALKLVVTGFCFWYLSWQIDFRQVISSIPHLEFRWAAFAMALVMLQIPLVATRWREILHVLGAITERTTNASIVAITAIGIFFAQVLPSVLGEGIRAWLIVRLGCAWRTAVTSVVIDRAIGAALLIAGGFFILLLPSGLTALGEYRETVLIIYGALLLLGAGGFLLLPQLIRLLGRMAYLRWMALLAIDARRVVISPRGLAILSIACVIHALTILIVWSLGRAQGLILPPSDAAVLFVVVIGVALAPISINGWGLRELAVVALLGRYGVPPEQALVFSVCFGLVLAAGSLPGAAAWLLYTLAAPKQSVECTR